LPSHQVARGSTRSGEQGQLEHQLEPQVPDVFDWFVEPATNQGRTPSGDPVDHPVGPGISRFDVQGLGEICLNETIQRSIDEGAPHGEHPAQVGPAAQLPGDGKTVGRSFGEDPEDGMLGQGQLGHRPSSSGTVISMRVVTMRIARVVMALALAGVLAACSTQTGEETLVVSAAASLDEAFTEIAAVFEDQHPGNDVLLNFAGSSTLREQILEGSPVDVLASANIPNMDAVAEAGEITGQPEIFALNQLQIAVPAGNPAGVNGLTDFSDESLLIGLCAEGVPCGDFARESLALAGVLPAVDSNEPDVRALLTKIAAGELDAGITYVTDVVASDDVEGIVIADEFNVVAEYPIATVSSGASADSAVAFVELVLSETGQAILRDHGFSSP